MDIRIFAFALAAIILLACLTGCTSPVEDGGDASSADTAENTGLVTSGTAAGGDVTEPAQTEARTDNSNREIRVLFIGNSLTYYNDMPELLEKLAVSAGKKITVESATEGSSTMCQQTSTTTSIGLMVKNYMKQKWDYVVLQPSRRITSKENTVKNAEFDAGKVLDSWIKDAGAKTLLYCTWGNNTGSASIYTMNADKVNASSSGSFAITQDEHSKYMQSISREYSELLGADLVDCAELFRYMLNEQPSVNVYYTDNRHPSLYGSYAVACAFYSYLYGESAEEAAKKYHTGISEDLAVMLAKAAAHVINGSEAPAAYTFPVSPVEVTADMKEWTGNGTESSPYIISCAEEFRYFAALSAAGETFSGKYVKQTADISFGGGEIKPVGPTADVPFSGTYDGGEKAVGYFSITADAEAALFANTNGAVIKNVRIENGTSKGATAGVLAGNSKKTVFENCRTEGSSSAEGVQFAGGIVAYGEDITVTRCFNAAPVSARETGSDNNYVGGIAGIAGNSVVSYCENAGDVSVYNSTSGKNGVAGGIVGCNGFQKGGACNVDRCVNRGTVSFTYDGSVASRGYTGGIVGRAGQSTSFSSTVTNCCNTGMIINKSTNTKYTGYVGQILGCVVNATVSASDCYGLDTVSDEIAKARGTDATGTSFMIGKLGSGVPAIKLSDKLALRTASELDALIKSISAG